MGKRIDLAGERFGHWLVQTEVGRRDSAGGLYWECKCDCGRIKQVSGKKLRAGKSLSCGCGKRSSYRGVDLTGKLFNNLRVVGREKNKHGQYEWRCICVCSREVFLSSSSLISGKSKSCGCLKSSLISEANKTHGMCHSSEYNIWLKMKDRCYKLDAKSYHNYGARGIEVCERWRHSFENFYEDMGPRPEGTSLDRIDNNGNYKPENCRWATCYEQSRNSRQNVFITHGGVTKVVRDWASYLGMNYGTLLHRIRRGWDVHDALTKPVRAY